MKSLKVYIVALAAAFLISCGVSFASESKDGVVICYSRPLEKVAKVWGSEAAYSAYEDFVDRSAQESIQFGYYPMRGAAAEYSGGARIGMVHGWIFYDRNVEIGGEYEIGISGERIRQDIGETFVGCKFLMEMPVCALKDKEAVSVSCDSKNAVK